MQSLKILCVVLATVVFAEELPPPPLAQPAPAAAAPGTQRDLVVLPASDGTGLNMGAAIQKAFGQLLADTGLFKIRFGTYVVTGYTTSAISKAHQELSSDLIAFAYLEKQRINLFLFDHNRPEQFIIAAEPIDGNTPLSPQIVDGKLAGAFAQLIQMFKTDQFQPLPGIDSDSVELSNEEKEEQKKRMTEARELFHEMSLVVDRPFYVGASIGMARYSSTLNSASNVDFGFVIGRHFGNYIRVEAGADVFSYAMATGSVHSRIPFGERYVSLSLGLGGGYVISQTTANTGFDTPSIKAGDMMFGPMLTFTIPLLGANIRGELRYYLGASSLFVGTYGLSCAL